MAAYKRKREAGEEEFGGDSTRLRIPLSAKRIARVYSFKDMMLVDVREMWTDASGAEKPSKKGISLTKEQFQKLVDHAPQILAAFDGDVVDKSAAEAVSSKGGPKAAKTEAESKGTHGDD